MGSINNIDKINNTSIPNSVLVKGISYDDFVKLFNELKKTIIEEGVTSLNDYTKVVDAVRKNDVTPETEEWINKFLTQVDESTKVINDEFAMIEELFERMFHDWQKYQEKHISVLEVEQKKEPGAEEKKGDTDE